jgi:hypothetical protein
MDVILRRLEIWSGGKQLRAAHQDEAPTPGRIRPCPVMVGDWREVSAEGLDRVSIFTHGKELK